ncbi:winged helix-turn-helix domain-containing protein [Billgrantia lactosivorans]|uniref:winged helix-turn-helix domain-containing protein n=1 Tax=Billgrantia lactosivorans TaxID=2185141 RepID=UPI001C554308|nr:LysR family transcriptional regulator [Halomonas lactosivorans]
MSAPNPSTPRLRVQLGHAIAMGPGKAQLLEAIAGSGSISAAARQLGMSYRRAWLLVDTMNQCFKAPLVTTATGGKGGGGAQVTALGEEVLERYRRMQRIASEAVAEEMEAFAALIAEPPATPERPR